MGGGGSVSNFPCWLDIKSLFDFFISDSYFSSSSLKADVHELSVWWCSQSLFMPRLIETCQPHKKSCQCQRTVACVVINRVLLFLSELRIKMYSLPYMFTWPGGFLQNWDRTYLFYNIFKILLSLVLNVPSFLSFPSPELTLPEFTSLVYCLVGSPLFTISPWFSLFWGYFQYHFSCYRVFSTVKSPIIFTVIFTFLWDSLQQQSLTKYSYLNYNGSRLLRYGTRVSYPQKPHMAHDYPLGQCWSRNFCHYRRFPALPWNIRSLFLKVGPQLITHLCFPSLKYNLTSLIQPNGLLVVESLSNSKKKHLFPPYMLASLLFHPP